MVATSATTMCGAAIGSAAPHTVATTATDLGNRRRTSNAAAPSVTRTVCATVGRCDPGSRLNAIWDMPISATMSDKPAARSRRMSLPSGCDKAGLVGEHHELGTVAGADFHHGAVDVGFG